jgi:NMD protein affecting ribosome stability and mRNA decay
MILRISELVRCDNCTYSTKGKRWKETFLEKSIKTIDTNSLMWYIKATTRKDESNVPVTPLLKKRIPQKLRATQEHQHKEPHI